MAVTTFAPLTSFIHQTALKTAESKLVHEAYGLSITIPEYNSAQVKLARYERFQTGATAASIRLLAEGTVPSNSNATRTTYTITTLQYGRTEQITDVTLVTNEVRPQPALQKLNSRDMAETLDKVYRDYMVAGTNYARLTDDAGASAGVNRTDVIGKINPDALDKMIRALDLQDAEYWTDAVSATTKVSTAGVLPSYVAIIHPAVYYDARRMPGWDDANKIYSGSLKGEVGAYKNIRFVMSTQAKVFPDAGAAVSGTGKGSTTGTSADVYPVLIFGKEAYACVKLANMARIIWIPPTTVDHFNPLGQWGTLGWKAQAAAGIINDNWIIRMECAATA